ncbi:hypothetical protein SEPCBS119000_005051 [Sporothrix epigloea]|uniref:Uncharacterized protein n=1 Tax=Sporothrix epigloea TaxID=1892477 RepID=A0ABP0DVI4_9PEZI
MTVASTDTTVKRLYTQYQTQLYDPTCANNSSPVPVIPHIIRSQNAAMGHSTNVQAQTDNASASSSPKKPGLPLTAPTRESLLYPKPLRVQSIRAGGKHTSVHSGITISATGMTSDSEEDPFRYDKDAYNIFLHPSKERDISAALNKVGCLSSRSRTTVYSDLYALPPRQISLRQSTVTKKYEVDLFSSDSKQVRSQTPKSLGEFYDTSFIQPNWAAERDAYEVKVVLQDVSHNARISPSDRSRPIYDGAFKGNKILRTTGLGPIQKENYHRRKDEENILSNERDDWETVATTQGGFGSMRLPLGEIGVNGANITGSSVADWNIQAAMKTR